MSAKPVYYVLGGLAVYFAYKGYQGANANTTSTDAALAALQSDFGALSMSPVSNMKMSPTGIAALISPEREGFNANSYPDASGRSIGYGHFIKPFESFTEPISVDLATRLLMTDIGSAEDAVRAYVKVPLNQNQFDALVSVVYNIGVGQKGFKGSQFLAALNTGDYAGCANLLDNWHRPASVISRRNSEKAQFLA